MAEKLLLTLNAGSSSVKIGIFRFEGDALECVGKAKVDLGSSPPVLYVIEGPKQIDFPLEYDAVNNLVRLMDEILKCLSECFNLTDMTAIGHRMVHGSDVFIHAVRLTDVSIKVIKKLINIAPLHQYQALRLVSAIRHLRPSVLQTASFDTAFHVTQSDLVRRLAIPRVYHNNGIKRYGFHGLSYQYVARSLTQLAPNIANGKVIIAHLGSGASLCAIDSGNSQDSSMGFSTLDGVPMATRPGWLDSGVLLHFLGPLGKSLAEVEDMLYHQCGLLGVSGLSGDIRKLFEIDSKEAKEAIDLFALRIAGEIGRLTATLEGLDALVFTAGIGENQPKIREYVAKRLCWLGIELDKNANDKNTQKISTSTSRVAVYIIPTNEEQIIAEECLQILNAMI